MTIDQPLLELYALRNRDGKWFRAKGYGGYGHSWVDTLERAKIYGKISTARTQVTWWMNNHPKYGAPELVKLKVLDLEVMDESDRLKRVREQARTRQERAEVRAKKSRVAWAKKELAEAEQKLRRAEQSLQAEEKKL